MANSVKKFGCVSLIVFLIIFVIMGIITNSLINKHSACKKSYEFNINKKVIINKDTLTVVNYSMWNESYNLSNGSVVDKTFVAGKTLK